jgi:transposase-like protein
MDTTSESTVTSSSSPRRFRSGAEKRRIVEATLVPGVSVATVARAQGINAQQVFHWRKPADLGGCLAIESLSAR